MTIIYGLISFATTAGGNVICMDLNSIKNSEPRVVYADKSWFLFNEEERKLEFSFYPFEIEEEWDAEDYYEKIGNVKGVFI